MLVAFHSSVHDAAPWQQALSELIPEAKFLSLEDAAHIDEESYAIVLYSPHGSLAKLPKLQAILSIAAGVDHLLSDPTLPDVPIYRQTCSSLQRTMVEYTMMSVLMHHRDMPQYILQQRKQCSDMLLPLKCSHQRSVAVLGLGNLGHEIATALQQFGFRTLGWSRSEKSLPNISCFHGEDGLHAMLAQSEILVNVLPLNQQTEHIINADFLSKLPKGASFVNIGRGGHVDEKSLMQMLDTGHINAAILDVQSIEPLPPEHSLWNHDKIVITPHIAGDILMDIAIPHTLQKIAALRRGETPSGRYDHRLGY